MKKEAGHTENHTGRESTGELDLKRFSIPYSRSREEVWESLEEKMNRYGIRDEKRRRLRWQYIAVAAIIALMLSSVGFVRFYSKTVYTSSGEKLAVFLPDESTVTLNQDSRLTYYPLWWNLNRRVKLEGEAYFQVIRGNRFRVQSPLGETIVLGTSFNVYARGTVYKVSCHSGSVKVQSQLSDESVVLKAREEAALREDGRIAVERNESLTNGPDWIHMQMNFQARPLKEVFEEIETAYGVDISFPENLDYSYTGNLSRTDSVETILLLVCKPFNLTFVRESIKRYRIRED